MAYNRRTSVLLQSWMARHNFKPIQHRMLLALFKGAWREVVTPPDGGYSLLKSCREYRCRAWWDSVKDLKAKRMSLGLVHAGMGGRVEWEDVFCIAFGSPWRLLRDDCQTQQQWLHLFPSFADKVCKAWGLPMTSVTDAVAVNEPFQTVEPDKKRPRTEKWQLSDIPWQHGCACPKVHWGKSSRSFAFVVDCKPVADILNGRCPLRSSGVDHMYERMTDKIVSMLS